MSTTLALLERALAPVRQRTAELQKPEPVTSRIRRAPQPRSVRTKQKLEHAKALIGQYTGAVAMHEGGAECNVRVTAEAYGPLGGLIVRLDGALPMACGTAQMAAKTFERLKTQKVFETEIFLNGRSGWFLHK